MPWGHPHEEILLREISPTLFRFRWELYNAFNHTQFQFVDNFAFFDPAGQQVNGRFGEVTTVRPPRIMQFSLRFQF